MRDSWPDESKYLTVAQLTKVLESIADKTLRLSPNAAGNMAVDSADGTQFVGWIDFAGEGDYCTCSSPYIYPL